MERVVVFSLGLGFGFMGCLLLAAALVPKAHLQEQMTLAEMAMTREVDPACR